MGHFVARLAVESEPGDQLPDPHAVEYEGPTRTNSQVNSEGSLFRRSRSLVPFIFEQHFTQMRKGARRAEETKSDDDQYYQDTKNR